jgi:four helix bundle protein
LEDLKVWQISHQLVLQVYSMTKTFPTEERFRLTDQLCRAAISIPTNIAEGKGRNSTKEYIHFVSISRGSVEEVNYLLLLAQDLGYIPVETYSAINTEYQRVGRMLNGLIKALKQNL